MSMLFMVPTRTRFLTEFCRRRENLPAPVGRWAVPRGGNPPEPSELGLGKQVLQLLHGYTLCMDRYAVKCEEPVRYTGNSASNASGETVSTSAKGAKSEPLPVISREIAWTAMTAQRLAS